ncbi:phage tail tube protein [Clostridioides difficile]|uniref:phage tail tube protein n=1 Tax=Clostridioides difficile TaxID=1496 RepID=UPI00370ABF6A
MYNDDYIEEASFLNGSDVVILIDGVEELYMEEIKADFEQDEQSIKLLGCQNEISRVGTTKGSFSLNGYKTNSRFAKLGFRSFEIIYKLSNPETLVYESIRLKNCRLKKLPLINSKAGEIVKIEVEGSFRGYDLLNEL